MEVRWERLTAPELKALAERNALPVLPVGSLEQHGPHLPVWTDSHAAHALSVRAAEQATDIPAVVLPPMWMGLSEHHFPFGGTVSLDYATFHAVLRCVVRSLRADGLLTIPVTDDRALHFKLDEPHELMFGWYEVVIPASGGPTTNTRALMTYAILSQGGRQLFLKAEESVREAQAVGWPNLTGSATPALGVRLWAGDLVALVEAVRMRPGPNADV